MTGIAPVLAAVCLAIAVASDLARREIPNGASLGLAVAFFLSTLAATATSSALGTGLAVGALVGGLGIGAWARGWIGGGDAKLLAAAALWIGWEPLVGFLLVTALGGGILVLGMRVVGRTPVGALAVPYALPIAIAIAVSAPASPFFLGA